MGLKVKLISNAIGEELKLLAMEASIARGFIPSQNKAVYIYILIHKRVI